MPIRERLADALVDSFLGGRWTLSEMVSRASSLFAVPRDREWLKTLIVDVLQAFPETKPRPITRTLKQFVIARTRISKSERRDGETRLVRVRPTWRPAMQPAAGPASQWVVIELVSPGEVAEWLGLTVGELDWFANPCQWKDESLPERLGHYRYRWIKKPSGGLRLLESPKPRLKQIQRRILDQIVARVPPHQAAHAYRTGRSIASHVAPHAGQNLVLHIDLREFFPSITASRVHATFRTMGYPERIASILTGLCTHSTPSFALQAGLVRVHDEQTWARLRSPHLPQGAPTSPALANLCAWRLDARLSGLAREISANYTRYADDLVFSGSHSLKKSLKRLRVLINAIVLDEGFEIRQRKTRVMVQGTRQQVSGIRINRHPNIPREAFDELKAILHNCRRFGPDTQNRSGQANFREHLKGRLAYWSSICPNRIAKLNRIFDEIDWSNDARKLPQ